MTTRRAFLRLVASAPVAAPVALAGGGVYASGGVVRGLVPYHAAYVLSDGAVPDGIYGGIGSEMFVAHGGRIDLWQDGRLVEANYLVDDLPLDHITSGGIRRPPELPADGAKGGSLPPTAVDPSSLNFAPAGSQPAGVPFGEVPDEFPDRALASLASNRAQIVPSDCMSMASFREREEHGQCPDGRKSLPGSRKIAELLL